MDQKNKTKIFRADHTANTSSSRPSCSPCRARFSTIDAIQINDGEWFVYCLAEYLDKVELTVITGIKSGRNFTASCWGALRDFNGRWGHELTIKLPAGMVRSLIKTQILNP